MGVRVDFSKAQEKRPYIIERRVGLLKAAGFGDGEIEIMKYCRLYYHSVIDKTGKERWSTAAVNLYRRRKRLVRRLAKDTGISEADAARELRDDANRAIKAWQEDYTGLPPEYDPINLMGYAVYMYV